MDEGSIAASLGSQMSSSEVKIKIKLDNRKINKGYLPWSIKFKRKLKLCINILNFYLLLQTFFLSLFSDPISNANHGAFSPTLSLDFVLFGLQLQATSSDEFILKRNVIATVKAE